jgi:WD40 repeat protein
MFSSDGKTLMSAGYDHVWLDDVSTRKLPGKDFAILKQHLTHGGGGAKMMFSRNGRVLVNFNNGFIVKAGKGKDVVLSDLWDVQTGRKKLTLKGRPDRLRSVAISPDGKLVACGTDYAVRLWNAEIGYLKSTLKTLNMGVDGVDALAFSPDGRTLAVGGYGGSLVLWKM